MNVIESFHSKEQEPELTHSQRRRLHTSLYKFLGRDIRENL